MKSATFTIAAVLLLAASVAAAQDQTSASITQSGVGNQSYVEQHQVSSESHLTITQQGNYNSVGDPGGRTGGVVQRGTDRMRITVTQLGDNNQAAFGQITGDKDQASVNQTGNGNFAAIEQHGAYESVVNIEQHGDRNRIDSAGGEILAFGFIASQTGSDNLASLARSWSGFGGPRVTQEGIGNRASVSQDQADYSFVEIRQLGMDNQTTVGQINTLFTTAWITQSGDGFSATITQTGNGNSAGIYQH